MEDQFYGDNSQRSSQGSKTAVADDLNFSKMAIMTESVSGRQGNVMQDVREKLS